MAELWLPLGVAILWIGTLAGLVRSFHMLQQNSYRAGRYMRWAKTAPKGRPAACLLAAAVWAGAWFVWRPLLPFLAACFAAVRIARQVSEQKKAIKPLVFTARVKRLWVTACLLAAADGALCFVLAQPGRLWAALAGVLCFAFAPLVALAALFINAPGEKLVARWYIGDAKRRLKRSPGLVVLGVTGSYGKTGVKFMITRLLQEKYTVTCTPESFNTPMGVVRTIREKWKPGTQIFVVEMGAKQVGDIAEICRIVHPDHGVITAIGPQHLDTFKSMDNIIATKFELADAVAARQGVMFLNCDSAPVADHAPVPKAVRYGTDPALDVYAADLRYEPDGACFTVCAGNVRLPVRTRLLGQHNVVNVTAAVAVALHFGVDPADIQFAVSRLQPAEHRLQPKRFDRGATLIDDAYNANPAGSIEAVNVLGRFENKRKIIVTPGLVELGEQEQQHNFNLGVRAGQVCDDIYLVGTNRSKPIADGVRSTGFNEERLHIAASFREVMDALRPTLDDTCVVLLENDLPDNYLY